MVSTSITHRPTSQSTSAPRSGLCRHRQVPRCAGEFLSCVRGEHGRSMPLGRAAAKRRLPDDGALPRAHGTCRQHAGQRHPRHRNRLVVSGGTVDKVSYTRDVAAVMEENAGHWGMTMFGLIFLRLQRTVGAGPVQVGVPFGFGSGLPQSASLYNGAWPGPTMTMPYSW